MPFRISAANMAALLRSAKLLRISPSNLLHITGTKRNRPPLSRLYSGALGTSRTGVCSRLIGPTVGNAVSSSVWPYTVGCVRGYAVATDEKDEASVLWSKQARHFDWAMAKLDGSVRWTGHITKSLLLKVFNDTCRTGCPSGNLALLLLRSCGSLLPEVPLAERTELAHRVWERLQELGAQYDISHYNALLKVYLQNEFKFSPNDFLAKMEAANIQPNRVTYQRLIAAYCQNGDIEGASTILGFMKSKDLPITEAAFNSLVTGHSRAGDIESAKNILSVMRGVGIEPGPDTYVSLLTAFAEKGDLDSVKKTMEDAETAHCNLMDRDILQVIFSLAKAGHQEHIPEMVGRLRNERGYVPDAMNMCVDLVTQGLVDTALTILKTFSTLELDSYNNNNFINLGNVILRHCVNMDMPVEKISQFCKELQESNPHSSPLIFSLHTALKAKKTDMSFDLMKILKEQGSPLRPHYFWPLLAPHVTTQNTAELLKILKGVQELGVSPDTETFITYIIPAFPTIEEAKRALLDLGFPLDPKDFFSVEVRILAAKDLAKIYELLSDPSAPSLDYRIFQNTLILATRKSDDVENLVKLTLLLCNDKRFCVPDFKPAEALSYFLFNLFSTLRREEVQAREAMLRKYLNQLRDQKIGISLSSYKGIRNVLESRQVPELIKDVHTLVSHSHTEGASSDYIYMGLKETEVPLDVKLAELKANNKPFGFLLTKAIQAHCSDENLALALELKNKYEEEMTASCYAILINECCRHGNVEEAMNLKRELSHKDSSVTLDVSKYLALIKALSSNGRVEEAVDILKEMKEKEVVITDKHVGMLFHMLNNLVTKGGAPVIRPLMETIFTLDLAKPSTSLCSPLISAYLDSNDVAGALEAAEYCQKRFNSLPRVHDILAFLVEKEDTELLEKAVGIFTQGRGEMNAMYDLFFAFLQTGRYREARKVIETPGLRARPGRLQWYAEKCISSKQMEPLEEMVDMTAKLFECDRDEMYSYIFRLCKETNNWKKAEMVWLKMQEENVIPRQRTLQMLADILQTNGQEVPFEMPETWYERSAAVTPTRPKTDTKVQLLALCKEGKAKEAVELLKEADGKNVILSSSGYDALIRSMLAEGAMEDAMVVLNIATSRVPGFHLSTPASNMLIITHSKKGQLKDAVEVLKTLLAADAVPSRLAMTRLVQALGSHGDLEGIQEVESLTKDLSAQHTLNSTIFLNSRVLAHVKNDNVDAAVEMLESIYTNPDSGTPRLSFVFRKLLEEGNDKALDKLSAMAERLANHFACYKPSLDLFFMLVDMDKLEDAKFMLARCNALAEQKVALKGFLTQTTKNPGQLGKVKSLLSLIPDAIEKEDLYKYMMKCHALDKDLPSAKALYEQMQKEEVDIDELTLKRLALLYRNAGESVPFPEPPKSFRFYAEKLRDRTSEDKMEAEE